MNNFDPFPWKLATPSPLAIDFAPFEAFTNSALLIREEDPSVLAPLCRLWITWPNGATDWGSAFCISPTLAVTAGHCVYEHGFLTPEGPKNLYARSIAVLAAGGGGASGVRLRATGFATSKGWAESRDRSSDFGVIRFDPATPAPDFLQLGTGLQAEVSVIGYPAVANPVGSAWCARGSGAVREPHYLDYVAQSFGGMSGGPVFDGDDRSEAIGIHAYFGQGVHIVDGVLDALRYWLSH